MFNTTFNSLILKIKIKIENEHIFINRYSCFWPFFNHKLIVNNQLLVYKKLSTDLINKLIPTKRQINVKVFFTNLFPFNFDK